MSEMRRTRLRVLLGMFTVLVVVGVFLVRLVDVQVVRAADINGQSAGKRSVPETLWAARGDILDAEGTVLATTVTRYNVKVDPSILMKNGVTDALRDELARIGAATGEDPAAMLATLEADPDTNFAYLAKGVDLDAFRTVKALKYPGVFFERQPERVYPNGAIGGNLIGFLGTDGPGAGVELMEQECLASDNGLKTYVASPDGVVITGSEVVEKQPVDGGTVRLTIQRDLQWYAQQVLGEQSQAMGATWATAIVVDVRTGHVLAAADYPSVDPNDVDSAPRDADGNLIIGSRAFSVPYEPGSTIKALTASALIDSGRATPASRTVAPNWFTTSNGERFTNSEPGGDQRLTLAGVVAQSSNTGISMFNRDTGFTAAERGAYLESYGFGSVTAVDFNHGGESAGMFGDPASWPELTAYQTAFGQGFSATSAQVAGAYQALGNGGERLPLTLVEGCTRADGTVVDLPPTDPTHVISEGAAQQTLQMMEQVPTLGTLKNRIDVPGYRVAAKSGTAQVALPNGAGYGGDRVLSVAGVAPAEDPRFAVVATFGVPDTMVTSAVAAPTFSRIMSQALTTYRVPPSTEPSTPLPTTW